MHMDEFIDELLCVCSIILPQLQKQYILQGAEQSSLVLMLWKKRWMMQNLVRRRKMSTSPRRND